VCTNNTMLVSRLTTILLFKAVAGQLNAGRAGELGAVPQGLGSSKHHGRPAVGLVVS
jgi:hypothetical protein